ncbi:N-acetylmuramic acid 6-phosphate etherase [Paenibacillus humicola]|uniref:N-acetylmuramic acid 6-phosphate etherase n=1 Tax=Paenibacillus humicola TaxID=3110540 RepID=UPI00237AF214|nr:N-acetylmuramic acid 6-phosphate etherase [Paenibacillus humicola]
MNLSTRHLISEQQNERTRHIDEKSTEDILRLINEEDHRVPEVVKACIPAIALAVDAIVAGLKQGGRLIYIGAGTSGRLGILDASECPPTYGTDPGQVIGIIAGGERAIRHPVEGMEDDEESGRQEVERLHPGPRDVVVGIAASGRTPYVLAAMKRARELGATVVGISNNSPSAMREAASIMIEAVVGPEVVLGSTRMKAGTAQKLILNMLTTASMIRIGKVYDNLMVDMQTSNRKLVERGKRLIEMATGADRETVERAYLEADGHVKTAIIMVLLNAGADEARDLLLRTDGYIRKAIELAGAGGS